MYGTLLTSYGVENDNNVHFKERRYENIPTTNSFQLSCVGKVCLRVEKTMKEKVVCQDFNWIFLYHLEIFSESITPTLPLSFKSLLVANGSLFGALL